MKLFLNYLILLAIVSFTSHAQRENEGPLFDACMISEINKSNDEVPVGELRKICKKKPSSPLEEKLRLEKSAASNPFAILPHKPNYLLPFTYSKVNDAPYSGMLNGNELDDTEIKLQVSLKYIAVENFLINALDVELALTTTSWWQAYNTDISTPFRETVYEPEMIFSYQKPWSVFGFPIEKSFISINHQSNGQSGNLSRSWNRIIGGLIFNSGDLFWGIKAWWRIPEESKTSDVDPTGDDNPNIESYLGYGEVVALWKVTEDHNLDMELRNNLSNDNRGSVLLGWSFPLTKHLRGYVQYFNGYGESLIYYNQHSERFGIGVKLTDWL
jgi:phospholipase A1